jgi:hypothetical protein
VREDSASALFLLRDRTVVVPHLAVGCSSGHGPQEVRVDLDDFLDGLRRDVGAHGGARVDRDDDAALEDEPEGGGAVARLDVLDHLALECVDLKGRRKGGRECDTWMD